MHKTLREGQGGKEEVGEGKMRKRRRKGGQEEEYADKRAMQCNETKNKISPVN